MKKSFFAAFGAIIFSVLVAAGAAKLVFTPVNEEFQSSKGDEQAVAAEENSVPQSSAEQFQEAASEGFYITGYEGEIAVFRESDTVKPIMVFEGVYLHQLPEYDRQQIEKKIYAKDYAELTSMLEDYIS